MLSFPPRQSSSSLQPDTLPLDGFTQDIRLLHRTRRLGFAVLGRHSSKVSILTLRLARDSFCLNLAAGGANENVHLWKYATSWNSADKLHDLAASGAND